MALERILNRQIEDPYLPTEPISNSPKDIVQFQCYLLYDYIRVGLGYFVDDIVKKPLVNQALNWVIDNTKDSDRAIAIGTIGSMIINPLSVGIANSSTDDPSILNDVGYVAETISYTLIAAPAMYLQKREEGLSRIEAGWKTVKWGIVAGFLSYYYYKEGRGKMATQLHEFVKIPYSVGNLTSQLVGMFPFMWMLRGADGALKWSDKKEDEWKGRVREYLKERKESKNQIYKEN